jgi:hypothetical protein
MATEALQQAQAEKLTLLVADNRTGHFGVYHKPGRPKPYQAQVRRGGKDVSLGSFATAEEAALCVARSPEGRAAAGRAAAAEGQGTLPAVSSGASLKEEVTVPPMPPGAFVKRRRAWSRPCRPMPSSRSRLLSSRRRALLLTSDRFVERRCQHLERRCEPLGRV